MSLKEEAPVYAATREGRREDEVFESCGRANLRNPAPRPTFSSGSLNSGRRVSVYKRWHHLRELTVGSQPA